jgi:NAD(P)-dependent dehydrogenase (short-subunit alcohol dehydrogenase family)
MMALNLKSAFLCCKHVLRAMRRTGEGRIINVASKACLDIQPGAAAYAVAKGGVVTLTRALREELKDARISVNALMPSIIDTPVTRELMPDGDPDRWVKPQQIADAVVALCGEGCGAVSGSVIRMFGAL